MSDIGIRLHGFVLLAAIVFGVVTYAVIGIIAGARWIAKRASHARSGRIAGYAFAATALQMIVFAVVFAAANGPQTGPDIIDWFSVPYVLACIAGYFALARSA